MRAFIDGETLYLHLGDVEARFQFTAFGAKGRIGSDGEMDGLIVA